MNKKYKQKIIPECNTDKLRNMRLKEVREFVLKYIREHFTGKSVVNEHLRIPIEITTRGAKKTALGDAMYSKKAAAITVLPELIKYAEYSNFGNRKDKDSKNVIGYLNFKAKCKIDNKTEYIHLIVRFQTDGKFYYSLEINKVNKARS